jgi:hypothetical protein
VYRAIEWFPRFSGQNCDVPQIQSPYRHFPRGFNSHVTNRLRCVV